MPPHADIVIVGAGPAGLFAALRCAEIHADSRILILEKTGHCLTKLKASGGGRCNLTHACFDPRKLATYYPRGSRELVGPFSRFQPRDTMTWFESHGVPLKVEADGRVFPLSNHSSTIADCLLHQARQRGIVFHLKEYPIAIHKTDSGFRIDLSTGSSLQSHRLLLATGGSPQGHQLAHSLGHSISPPIPSLFSLRVTSSPFQDLSGMAVPDVELGLAESNVKARGSLLLTHSGLSGPVALTLSSWGARLLHDARYQARLIVHWLPDHSLTSIYRDLVAFKDSRTQPQLASESPFSLPKKLWRRLVESAPLPCSKRWGELSRKDLQLLAQLLCHSELQVNGRDLHKEEFVTCGGVTLKEVNFKTMASRICQGLFLAGELLDIDGLTGGFNLQNAWTTGWLAGQGMV